MGLVRLFTGRVRLIACACAFAAVTAGINAVVSAGPSAGSASAQTASCAPGTTVQTTAGPVCGVTTASGVNEWLGVPYAAPPVGALRWAPPQPHAPWTTTLEATAFADECVQPVVNSGLPAPGSSEDCLYLNVYAPAAG